MTTLKLNDLQRLTLYRFVQAQGKGEPHLRRLERLRAAFGIGAIETRIDDANDKMEALRAADKPVPRRLSQLLQYDDPVAESSVNEGDLDKIQHRLAHAWGAEGEAHAGKEVEPACKACGRAREVQDPRLHLKIVEEVSRAWKEVCAARESKSNGSEATKDDSTTADASGTP